MLTVAICTHARPLDTLTCLQAIDRQRREMPLPILIVDNASPPSDSKILQRGIANLRDVEYLYEPRPGDTERQIESDQAPNFVGCNMIIRRATLAALGGFNVALGRTPGSLLGGEEGDLANRARARGMHTQFSAELGVQHRIHPERLTLSWLRARADAEGQRLWFAWPSKRRLLKSVASLPALACLSALESHQNRVINDNARLWRNIGYVKAGARQLRRMSTP